MRIYTNTVLAAAGIVSIHVDPTICFIQSFTLSGSLVGNLGDISRTLDFDKKGILNPPINIFGIDQLPEADEKLAKGEIARRAVVYFNI
jgi:D-arabinose 1-dehydrogenase-like Zn-dependent alcohol dehydrogenase